jgi:uncharacterized linocin/CFP29 family protein
LDREALCRLRGGDFELSIGQDISIGYLSHMDAVVRRYLQESFPFRPFTSEAFVVLASPLESA